MEVWGLSRETVSKSLGNLHFKVSMDTGVWVGGVKVIEEKASRLSTLKMCI